MGAQRNAKMNRSSESKRAMELQQDFMKDGSRRMSKAREAMGQLQISSRKRKRCKLMGLLCSDALGCFGIYKKGVEKSTDLNHPYLSEEKIN